MTMPDPSSSGSQGVELLTFFCGVCVSVVICGMRGLVAGCEIVVVEPKKDEVSPLTATTRCHSPLCGVFGFGDGRKKMRDIITLIVSYPGPTRSTSTRPRLFPIPNNTTTCLCATGISDPHTHLPSFAPTLLSTRLSLSLLTDYFRTHAWKMPKHQWDQW
jgi:hypothetical protein